MDNDKPTTDAPGTARSAGRSLPKNPVFSAFPKDEAAPSEAAATPPTGSAVAVPADISASDLGERDSVFRQLVSADSDIAGLVAYSIYKQNKVDWMSAFRNAKARPPSEDELESYIIGEGTPRRITTYRHLAEAMLAGNGPGTGRSAQSTRAGMRRGAGPTGGMLLLYAVVAMILLAGFLLAGHYTVTSK